MSGRFKSMKNLEDPTGNQAHDLLVYSAVPQLTVLLHTLNTVRFLHNHIPYCWPCIIIPFHFPWNYFRQKWAICIRLLNRSRCSCCGNVGLMLNSQHRKPLDYFLVWHLSVNLASKEHKLLPVLLLGSSGALRLSHHNVTQYLGKAVFILHRWSICTVLSVSQPADINIDAQ
jgi:hypothetical protein